MLALRVPGLRHRSFWVPSVTGLEFLSWFSMSLASTYWSTAGWDRLGGRRLRAMWDRLALPLLLTASEIFPDSSLGIRFPAPGCLL